MRIHPETTSRARRPRRASRTTAALLAAALPQLASACGGSDRGGDFDLLVMCADGSGLPTVPHECREAAP